MRFNQYESALKAVREMLLIIGLLVGGAWAVFVFVVEEHAKLAELNATRLQMENKSLQDEWASNLDISLAIQSTPAKTRPGFYIQAVITLQNKGKLKGEFILDEEAFRLFMVEFDKNGKPFYGKVLLRDQVSMPQPANRALLLPGETARFPFIHYTEQAGLYYIDFSVKQSLDNLKVWPKSWIKPNKAYVWTNSQFVDVGPMSMKP
jgi:hypothetical protein